MQLLLNMGDHARMCLLSPKQCCNAQALTVELAVVLDAATWGSLLLSAACPTCAYNAMALLHVLILSREVPLLDPLPV